MRSAGRPAASRSAGTASLSPIRPRASAAARRLCGGGPCSSSIRSRRRLAVAPEAGDMEPPPGGPVRRDLQRKCWTMRACARSGRSAQSVQTTVRSQDAARFLVCAHFAECRENMRRLARAAQGPTSTSRRHGRLRVAEQLDRVIEWHRRATIVTAVRTASLPKGRSLQPRLGR